MRFSILSRQDNLSNEVACKIKKRINLEYDDINPDYVVAVGGDGTILSAVHKYPNAVVFGVHTGHLGFYANYSVENIDDLSIPRPESLSSEIQQRKMQFLEMITNRR